MRRPVAALACVAIVGTLLSACGNGRVETQVTLLRAITATEKASRKYVYTDVDGKGVRTQVVGLIEDDFRHKERLTIGSVVAADQVVSDDALAVRITSDAALARLVNRNPIPKLTAADAAPDPTAPTAADALAALKQQQWVLDPAGAPPLVRPATIGPGGVERDPITGDDPLLDANDIFNYVRRAIAGAFNVQKFNPDDINYKPSEDPFTKPDLRGPIERFDLLRPFLPVATIEGGNARSNLPGPQHFRKMAIYVKDGRVTKVAEELFPAERLKQTIERGVAFLKKAGASEKILDQTRALKRAPKKAASVAIIGALNVLRERNSDVPIRLRSMTLTITNLGDRDLHAVLPPEAVRAPLDILKNRGQTASLPTANAASSGPGGSSSTTTVPGNTDSTEITVPGDTTSSSAPPPP